MNLTWNDLTFWGTFYRQLTCCTWGGGNFVFCFHSTVANWWFYKINIIACCINKHVI